MRTIARHFFVFNPCTKEYELDKDFVGYSPAQLEKMAKWRKQELLNANISPSMTVYEIDAEIRKNGLKKSIRVTDEEYRVIEAYSNADEMIKNKVKHC